MALTQVDDTDLIVAREIKGVGSAGVPDREDHRLGRNLRSGIEPDAVGGGVEAIDGVARPRRRIRAVQTLGRRNIVQQRRRRIVAAEIAAGVRFAPVAHDRVLARILIIYRVGIGRAAAAGIVVARVAQADRVPDLVQQHLIAIAQELRPGIVAQGRIDPDVARRGRMAGIAGQIGEGRRTRSARRIVAEQHGRGIGIGPRPRGAGTHAVKGDAGDIRPGLKHQLGGRDLGRGELGEA